MHWSWTIWLKKTVPFCWNDEPCWLSAEHWHCFKIKWHKKPLMLWLIWWMFQSENMCSQEPWWIQNCSCKEHWCLQIFCFRRDWQLQLFWRIFIYYYKTWCWCCRLWTSVSKEMISKNDIQTLLIKHTLTIKSASVTSLIKIKIFSLLNFLHTKCLITFS